MASLPDMWERTITFGNSIHECKSEEEEEEGAKKVKEWMGVGEGAGLIIIHIALLKLSLLLLLLLASCENRKCWKDILCDRLESRVGLWSILFHQCDGLDPSIWQLYSRHTLARGHCCGSRAVTWKELLPRVEADVLEEERQDGGDPQRVWPVSCRASRSLLCACWHVCYWWKEIYREGLWRRYLSIPFHHWQHLQKVKVSFDQIGSTAHVFCTPFFSFFFFFLLHWHMFNVLKGQQEKAQQETRDYHFCRWLTKEIGVGAIPPSAFYCNEHAHLAERFARFAFCKRDEVFEAARSRLQKLNKPPLNTSFNF